MRSRLDWCNPVSTFAASAQEWAFKCSFLPSNGTPSGKSNGNGHGGSHPEAWACTDKQRGLILDLTERHQLDKSAVEALAQDRFGKGVRQLNKLEASGLIDELIVQTGAQPGGARTYRGSRAQKAGVR